MKFIQILVLIAIVLIPLADASQAAAPRLRVSDNHRFLVYEDHPISFKADELGHSISADVRRPLYWDLFSGPCGHHSVWQMWAADRTPVNNPLIERFSA